MQQRQLRLGDVLDDYCPRERRVTNHAVVAMVGDDVKQTRCTTCDAEHEYKHAKIPRQRRKADATALYSQVLAGAPKRVAHDDEAPSEHDAPALEELPRTPQRDSLPKAETTLEPEVAAHAAAPDDAEASEEREDRDVIEEGPVHRPLIRATLPRPEGQPPPTRPAP